MKKVMRVGTMKVYNGFSASIFIKAEFKKSNLSISGVIGPLKNGDAIGGCGQINMEFAHRNEKDNDKRYDNPIKPEEINFAEGWDKEKWLDLLDVWKKYHLNDMKAGCEYQQENWDTQKEIELIEYKWSNTFYKNRCKAEHGELTTEDYGKFKIASELVKKCTLGYYSPKYESEEVKEALEKDLIQEEERKTKAAGWVSYKEHPEGLLGKPCPVCGYKYGTEWKRIEIPQDVIDFINSLPDADRSPAWI